MKHIPERVIPGQELKQCIICGRFFTPDRIRAHEAICQVSAGISRKTFNINDQIMRGSEAEAMIKQSEEENCRKNKRSGLNTNWRGKHEEFLKQIKEAKQQVSERSMNDSDFCNTPLMEDDLDCVQCQYCLRQYNKVSAARHISICAWRSAKTNQ